MYGDTYIVKSHGRKKKNSFHSQNLTIRTLCVWIQRYSIEEEWEEVVNDVYYVAKKSQIKLIEFRINGRKWFNPLTLSHFFFFFFCLPFIKSFGVE